jgi:hypothetical protein
MLRFANEPDTVLQAIIGAALEGMSAELDPYLPTYVPTAAEREEVEENFRELFPAVARVFSPATAVGVVKRLTQANADGSTLYQLTDYHWLMLYEALQHYCELHRDQAGQLDVGEYRIDRIDFSGLVERFFWDTDFLLSADIVLALGDEGRAMAGLNTETFGLAAGLKPHPDELVLEPVDWETDDGKPIMLRGPRGHRLRTYPPIRPQRWHRKAAE